MKLRFNSRDGRWPRDFKDYVFLGTALAYLNRALHRDARDQDVTATSSGVQQGQLPLLPGEPPDLFGYSRAHRARMLLGGLLLDGAIASFVHVNGTDQFLALPRMIWDLKPVTGLDLDELIAGSIGDTTAARRVDLALPDSLLKFGATVGSGDDAATGFVYVDREQFDALMKETNPKAYMPGLGSSTLLQLAGPESDLSHWDFLAASLWLITEDPAIISGAMNYLSGKSGSNALPGHYDVLHGLLQQEIPDHHCRCRQSICQCLTIAARTIQAVCKEDRLHATGLKFGTGDRLKVPADAWLGTIQFRQDVHLAPERDGGTEWDHVLFDPRQVKALASPFSSRTSQAKQRATTKTPAGAWRAWAKDAADRGVGIKKAHDDARARLGADAPGQVQARKLMRDEMESRGLMVQQGRPTSPKA